MKTLYLLVVINIGLILTGCAGKTQVAPKNSVAIAIYPSPTVPQRPYQVIKKVHVARVTNSAKSKTNWQAKLQQKAADLHADAIINVHKNPNSVSAEIITFKKILI